MREIYLTPEHSKWWLLSPGVTIYYDRIKICQSDFDQIQRVAGQSSYHSQIALQLDALSSRNDFPEIEIIPDSALELTENYQQRSEVLKNLLFRRAHDNQDPTLIPKDLVKLTIDAFQHWIEYNQNKVRYLRKDEAYRHLLGGDLIPSWQERMKSLVEIYNAPEKEILDRFLENKEAMSTFKRLLASCSRCIDLVDSGKQIYDPMLVEYLPVIQIIEGNRVSSSLVDKDGNFSKLFEAFRIRMARYTEILPIDLNLNDVANNITAYSTIRENLSKLDRTISSIKDSDLLTSLDDIRRDIGAIVSDINKLSSSISYGFWISGVIWTVASILGCPGFIQRINDAATTAYLMSKGVGRFAGAYSLITDRIVLQQDSVVSATRFHEVDYDYFKKHYWDFGRKTHNKAVHRTT
jgi:hypothetical protein